MTRDCSAFWPVALAVGVRLAAWLAVPASRFASDEDSYFLAGALRARGEQDLFWPPVTGWLMACARWILHTDSVSALRLLWVALDIGCVLAVRVLAGRLAPFVSSGDSGKARRFTMLATVGYALYLPAVSYAQFTTSETPALLQTLVGLVLLTRPDAGVATYALAGLVTGTLALTRPSLLPLLAMWPAAVWRTTRQSGRTRRLVAFLIAGGAVVGLWVVRNWTVTGEITIARNSSYNLYIGNRDAYAEDLNLFHPVATPEQVEFRRRQWSGELPHPAGTAAELQQQAYAWIARHPVIFARRAVGRLARVFAPKTDVLELAGGERRAGIFSPVSLVLLSVANAQWAVVLFAGLLGLFALRGRSPGLCILLTSTIAGSVLLCLVAISKPRYSFVFDPILILGLAAFLVAPHESWASIDRPARRALVAIYVFLAWGWIAWLVFAFSSRMAL